MTLFGGNKGHYRTYEHARAAKALQAAWVAYEASAAREAVAAYRKEGENPIQWMGIPPSGKFSTAHMGPPVAFLVDGPPPSPERQIRRLAEYLAKDWPGAITEGSAIDVAIKLLSTEKEKRLRASEYYAKKASLETSCWGCFWEANHALLAQGVKPFLVEPLPSSPPSPGVVVKATRKQRSLIGTLIRGDSMVIAVDTNLDVAGVTVRHQKEIEVFFNGVSVLVYDNGFKEERV